MYVNHAMILKSSLHNHWVGYSKLVRQKQRRKVILQLFYLRSLTAKGLIQISIRLEAEVE